MEKTAEIVTVCKAALQCDSLQSVIRGDQALAGCMNALCNEVIKRTRLEELAIKNGKPVGAQRGHLCHLGYVVSITGKRQCALIEVPDPAIREDFALIKIHSAPMCTEFKGYVDGQVGSCLGHEAAGEVVAVARHSSVKLGDRVVLMPLYPCGRCALCQDGDYIYCQHPVDPLSTCRTQTGIATYAEYCIKQDWLLVPIPDDISYDHAAMACCGLGPTFGAMQQMGVDGYDTVLITGLGPVGLGGVINGVYRGARVIGVESNPYRARLALQLGACAVIDPQAPDALDQVLGLTGTRGADKVIECTAVPAAQQFAVSAARRRGHVGFVGWGGSITMENMVPDGLTLQGCWHWNLRDTSKMLQLVRDCSSQLDQLITHTFPMSCVGDAWETQQTGECGKVVLHPWE